MTRPVVAVTGGGGGIGAAIAERLGRQGAFVVTMDPLVSLDGAEQLPPEDETTAGRIVAAGGAARATGVSVTDGPAVRALFEALVAEHGRLDAVVNVAGISRPTGFGRGTDEDWRAVLEVHLDGYRNVLEAALPLMAEAGSGRILGVTSGSGWRAADAGAYACAKRAVAALTWQVGRCPPPGVAVNAISPIAVTRMVTAALTRTPGGSSGGLRLGSMPEPAAIAPLGARLVGDDLSWCSGRVVFAGGTEAAVVQPPRLLEVVHTAGARSLAHLVDAVTPALAAAEAAQASGGGSNPRFGDAYAAEGDLPAPAVPTCAVVGDRPDVAAALEQRGVRLAGVDSAGAVVVDATGGPGAPATGWEGILRDHAGLVERIHADAGWTKVAAEAGRPVRLVLLVDATSAGGRSRAQAAAQLARSARAATKDRVAAFAVSVESAAPAEAAALAAHLASSPGAADLSGAELACGDGWIGLRSHPRPIAAVALGSPDRTDAVVDVLREVVG